MTQALTPSRTIAHIDLDAFFASVEVRDDPALRGKPVVVSGLSARSVVAAASYEARRFGIFSAMPLMTAKARCPDLVVIAPRIGYYAQVSEAFFTLLERWSPKVEGLSLDEAFLDLSGTDKLWGPPEEAIQRLRQEVWETLELTCSAGIAPVKFLAKVLSGQSKPNGQTRLLPSQIPAFLEHLPLTELWGVGKVRAEQLRALGLSFVGELNRYPEAELARVIGREAARHLKQLARGEDWREVEPEREAKSVGAEETFEHDLSDMPTLELYLLEQAERIAWRLRRGRVGASGLTLKMKANDFQELSRRTTFAPTDDAQTLFEAAKSLLHSTTLSRPLRLIGLSASPLGPLQPSLFDAVSPKRAALNAALDQIKERHGQSAIQRAALLKVTALDVRDKPAGYRK